MFEAARERPSLVRRLILAAAAIGCAIAIAGIWGSGVLDPPPAPPAPPEAPIVEATPAEVKAALREALAAVKGGRLFHLDCAPPGCVATIRMPIPRGRDAGWRNQLEHRLTSAGWHLKPPGKVEVFQPVPVNDDVLPERCYWTFGIRRDPVVATDEISSLNVRIASQSADAFFRYDPW